MNGSRWKVLVAAMGAVAALAAAALLFWPPANVEDAAGTAVGGGRAPDTATVKGELALQVYQLRDGHEEKATSGATFQAGDKLRFRVSTPAQGFVSILRIAADGTMYTAWPPGDGAPRALPASHDRALEEELELDDAPGHETLWLVHCKSEGRCVRVQTAMALGCPQDCVRTPFFLNKPR